MPIRMKIRSIGGRNYLRVPSTRACKGCDMKLQDNCLLSRTHNEAFCIEAGKTYIYKEMKSNADV